MPTAGLPKVARPKFPFKTKGNMWPTQQKGRIMRYRRKAPNQMTHSARASQGLAADHLSKQSSWRVEAKQCRPMLIRPNRFCPVRF
jgi:hypothetical protein